MTYRSQLGRYATTPSPLQESPNLPVMRVTTHPGSADAFTGMVYTRAPCLCEELTCSLACNGSEHHVTRVDGMDEVGWEGTSLADSLYWALICLMHQDDSLQERLDVCLGLQAAGH